MEHTKDVGMGCSKQDQVVDDDNNNNVSKIRRNSVLDDEIMRTMLVDRIRSTLPNNNISNTQNTLLNTNDAFLENRDNSISKDSSLSSFDSIDDSMDISLIPEDERERLERMYVMLRWSKKYKRALIGKANENWNNSIPSNSNSNSEDEIDNIETDNDNDVDGYKVQYSLGNIKKENGGLLNLNEIDLALNDLNSDDIIDKPKINIQNIDTNDDYDNKIPSLLRLKVGGLSSSLSQNQNQFKPPVPIKKQTKNFITNSTKSSPSSISSFGARPPPIPQPIDPQYSNKLNVSSSLSNGLNQYQNDIANTNVNNQFELDDTYYTDEGTLTNPSSAFSSKRSSIVTFSNDNLLATKPPSHGCLKNSSKLSSSTSINENGKAILESHKFKVSFNDCVTTISIPSFDSDTLDNSDLSEDGEIDNYDIDNSPKDEEIYGITRSISTPLGTATAHGRGNDRERILFESPSSLSPGGMMNMILNHNKKVRKTNSEETIVAGLNDSMINVNKSKFINNNNKSSNNTNTNISHISEAAL